MSSINSPAAYDRTEEAEALIGQLEHSLRQMRDGLKGLHDASWPVGGVCDALSDCLATIAAERMDLQADLADWRRSRRRSLVSEPFMGGASQ